MVWCGTAACSANALSFDPGIDVPGGYTLGPIVWLGPMDLPGLPANVVEADTSSGELYGSSVQNAVQGIIPPSAGPGVTFDASTMWQSGEAINGEVEITLTFPIEVMLDAIAIHSQHSGQYHAATGARIEVERDSVFEEIAADSAIAAGDTISFRAESATTWRLWLAAGESNQVTIRGLQFFLAGTEVFPPFVPYE